MTPQAVLRAVGATSGVVALILFVGVGPILAEEVMSFREWALAFGMSMFCFFLFSVFWEKEK